MSDSPKSPRTVTPLRWKSLTIAGAAIGIAVAGPAFSAGPDHHSVSGPETLWLTQSEGGEGGEGGEAGSETESGAVVELLTDLGLIEGHLRAGVALYQAGLADQAVTHMKHPQDEIYEELGYHLEEFGAKGFSDELSALAKTVESGASVGDAEATFAAVLTRIEEVRNHVGASGADRAQAILGLTRVAAEEYEEGVVDGAIAELHEYQDAWGFIQVARQMSENMAAEADEDEHIFGEKARIALDETADALPGVSPGDAALGDAAVLLAAAAKIELAAYSLR